MRCLNQSLHSISMEVIKTQTIWGKGVNYWLFSGYASTPARCQLQCFIKATAWWTDREYAWPLFVFCFCWCTRGRNYLFNLYIYFIIFIIFYYLFGYLFFGAGQEYSFEGLWDNAVPVQSHVSIPSKLSSICQPSFERFFWPSISMQIHIKWRYVVNMDTASHVGQEIYTEPIYVHTQKDIIKLQEVWQVYKSLQRYTNPSKLLLNNSFHLCHRHVVFLFCYSVREFRSSLWGNGVGRKRTSINPFFQIDLRLTQPMAKLYREYIFCRENKVQTFFFRVHWLSEKDWRINVCQKKHKMDRFDTAFFFVNGFLTESPLVYHPQKPNVFFSFEAQVFHATRPLRLDYFHVKFPELGDRNFRLSVLVRNNLEDHPI